MPSFAPMIWLILAAIAGGSVLGALYALARLHEREREVHELRNRVERLRRDYAARIAQIAAREHGVDYAEPVVPSSP